MPVQMDEHVGRELVQLALARRIVVKIFAKPPVAEIAQQEQPALHVARENLRAPSGPACASHSATATNGPHVLVLRRCVHEHGCPVAVNHRENSA